MHKLSMLKKLVWKLAILELEQCLGKIEIAPVLRSGTNFPSYMVNWLRLNEPRTFPTSNLKKSANLNK